MRTWLSGLGVMVGVASVACLVAAGLAAAASAPTAVTGAVTAFGPASATVRGTVNPNGQATTWYFEYGKDTKYGSMTPATNAGSDTANVDVSAIIDDLTPKTTYHYRFVATNLSGTTQGADGLFTTAAAAAPDAVTGSAGVSGTSATLNGNVNPNGRATTWFFEYGTSTSYGTKTPSQNGGTGTSAIGVSAPVSGLTPGAAYHFRLVAASDAGTSTGGDQVFSVAGAPPIATTSPASGISATAATLNGSVVPSGQATNWHFEYGTSTAYGTVTATKVTSAGTNAVAVSVKLSGLTPGTTYHVRLLATNASATSNGADQTFTTNGPAVVTGTAQGVGPTTATLTGSVDPRGATTSWYFEYGTSTRYDSRTATTGTNAGIGARGVSASILGLIPGATYHFRLVASSSANTTRGADTTFQTSSAAVTLNQPLALTTYGSTVVLSGSVSGGQGGATVSVLAQAFGATSFSPTATVKTDAAGSWTYTARPTIRTSYEAISYGITSPVVTTAVRPAVSLNVLTHARFSTRVTAGTSFAGRAVQLQRRSGGRWVTVRRARLNATSSATFHATTLPRGKSTIRIAMSVNQAGPGYLAGYSRTLSYTRR